MSHPLRFESKKGRICVAWVWNREGTEKLVNGKQHSVWFVPTGMKGLPQNVLLNFRLEFPKRGLTIYLPSGISEIFCQETIKQIPCRFGVFNDQFFLNKTILPRIYPEYILVPHTSLQKNGIFNLLMTFGLIFRMRWQTIKSGTHFCRDNISKM